jgi:hypothetical protein
MTQSRLVPCSSCQRHVRVSEAACPFCGASIADAAQSPPAVRMPATRLARAAIFALGTLGAGATAAAPGCGGTTTGTGTPSGDAGEDAGNIEPPYGALPPFPDASDDGGGQVVAAYGGAVIIDSGASNDAGETSDAAADAAADAADASGGGHTVVPPYGIAPAYGLPAPGFEIPAEKAPLKEPLN